MLAAIAFGWFLSISVRMIYPALLPYLRTTYGLTLTTAGLLLTVLWVAYGIGQLPGGIVADWAGERLLLILGSLIAAVMLTLVVIANSPIVLFTATALFGLGTALYGVSRFTILNDIYPDQMGTATGITLAAGDVGNATMPPIAGFIAATVAWQYGFGFAIPLFVFAAIALWLTLPTQPSTTGSLGDSVSVASIASMIRLPVVINATGMLILWSVIVQAFIGFYPTYLIDQRGIDTQVATALFGLFFALGILIKPIAGRAYDSIGIRLPLVVLTGGTALGLLGLPLTTSIWTVLGVTVLASSLLGFETVVVSNLTEQLPADNRATGLGTLRTIYLILGGLSPLVFGAVANRGYFDAAFFGIGVLALFLLPIILFGLEREAPRNDT